MIGKRKLIISLHLRNHSQHTKHPSSWMSGTRDTIYQILSIGSSSNDISSPRIMNPEIMLLSRRHIPCAIKLDLKSIHYNDMVPIWIPCSWYQILMFILIWDPFNSLFITKPIPFHILSRWHCIHWNLCFIRCIGSTGYIPLISDGLLLDKLCYVLLNQLILRLCSL